MIKFLCYYIYVVILLCYLVSSRQFAIEFSEYGITENTLIIALRIFILFSIWAAYSFKFKMLFHSNQQKHSK